MNWTRLLAVWAAGTALGQEIVLEANKLHLGKSGQFEWESFKDIPVDAERLERRFEAKTNTSAHTLRIWQRDVKLSWPVMLNGRRIGTLTNAETPLECVLTVPAGALRDGENLLMIDAPSALDDIEVGPVILDSRPQQEVIGGATIQVNAAPLPCRLTLTRKDGTLQPLRAEPAGEVAVRTGVVYTRQGRATLHVPPGDYLLHAGRGF